MSTSYTMVILPTNEDAKIIISAFCDKCCQRKLNYIIKYDLDINETNDLKKNSNIKFCKIICECKDKNMGISSPN